MTFDKVRLIYFSPTHTSKKIAQAIAKGVGLPYAEDDITYQSPAETKAIEENLTIVTVPVYGGRVPDTAAQRLEKFQSDGKFVIPVVVYGNRHYDDALLELSEILKSLGFIPVVAGAFVGEHSYSRKDLPIAAGRPDDKDIAVAVQFGKDAIRKLTAIPSLSGIIQLPGNYPYKEKGPANPQAPDINREICTCCDYCIDVCPVGAISITPDDLMVNDADICIKCCACVKECPEEARSFYSPFALVLNKNFNVRREPELFL